MQPRIHHEGHTEGKTIFYKQSPCPKCGKAEMEYIQKFTYLRCPVCGHLESRKKTRNWMDRAREGT